MSRIKVLGAAMALAVGSSIATAQTEVTNIFGGLDKVIPDSQLTAISDMENLTFSGAGMASLANPPVTLIIANGYNGDYYAYLVSHNGFVVTPNRVGRAAANVFGYGDAGRDASFNASGDDIHPYESLSAGFNRDQLTGTSAPDGLNVNPQFAADVDLQTTLLGSFSGANPNGPWTLFLSDLDFGQQGSPVSWGVIITSVPEPSAWALMGLGGLFWGIFCLRRWRLRQKPA